MKNQVCQYEKYDHSNLYGFANILLKIININESQKSPYRGTRLNELEHVRN
jgi:hypothetical protein